MSIVNLKIKGMGHYLPERIVTSSELDQKFGHKPGTFEKTSGVVSRRYAADDETNSKMGAKAAIEAIERAGIDLEDIDLILGACGTQEQAIPCTAAMVQRELGIENSGIPCFDINSTCLSFVTALNVAGKFVASGQHKNVLIVSADIASVGLNYRHLESASLFGDGAAAAIVGPTAEGEKSGLLSYHMETYSSGWDTCSIAGGGSRMHPSKMDWQLEKDDERFLFKMDGPKVFRLAAKYIGDFVGQLMQTTGYTLSDIDLVIPHQASESGMELIRRRLDVPVEKFMKINQEHGNMIAASIPLALYYATTQNRLTRGQTVALIGTSAGFSMGGVVLRY